MKRFAPLGVLLCPVAGTGSPAVRLRHPSHRQPRRPRQHPSRQLIPRLHRKRRPRSETPSSEEVTNIVETLAAMDDFSALSQAIVEADLVEKLSSAGPYTLFAPTDAAFAALDPDISGDPDLLFDLLLYHVVDEQITADDAAAMEMATSLLGDELQFSTEGDNLLVNGVVVVEADMETTNGVIHVIDTALIPPTLGSE